MMKKASDHEPPKLPPPKQHVKPSTDFSKPGLPLKKPVPPKPSTKPMLPSKKPVPKPPPTEPKREIPPKASLREKNVLKPSLKDDKASEAGTTSEGKIFGASCLSIWYMYLSILTRHFYKHFSYFSYPSK